MSAIPMSGTTALPERYEDPAPLPLEESYPSDREQEGFEPMWSDTDSYAPPQNELLAVFLPVLPSYDAESYSPAHPDASNEARSEAQLPSSNNTQMSLDIGGVTFDVEVDAEGYYLTRSKWSLVGFGLTLAEAEADLYREAVDLAADLSSAPLDSLSEDMKDLRDYVFRLI